MMEKKKKTKWSMWRSQTSSIINYAGCTAVAERQLLRKPEPITNQRFKSAPFQTKLQPTKLPGCVLLIPMRPPKNQFSSGTEEVRKRLASDIRKLSLSKLFFQQRGLG